jgi:hypothetical protein
LLFSWIFVHGILTLPLLGSFILSVHFRVKSLELSYLDAYKLKGGEIIKWSFLKRFRLEYILTLIFAFSFIWNDFGINSVLSDRIESFASILKMAFSGRAANQSIGLMYFSVSILVAFSSVLIWKTILNNAQKAIE